MRLQYEREKAGLSRNELGKLAHLDPTNIYAAESGRRRLSPVMQQSVMRALNWRRPYEELTKKVIIHEYNDFKGTPHITRMELMRHMNGLSRDELAKRVEVNSTTIYDYERGKIKVPDRANIRKIGDELGISKSLDPLEIITPEYLIIHPVTLDTIMRELQGENDAVETQDES